MIDYNFNAIFTLLFDAKLWKICESCFFSIIFLYIYRIIVPKTVFLQEHCER